MLVDPGLKESKIVIVREAFSQAFVSQNDSSGNEAASVELAFYQRNKNYLRDFKNYFE